MKEKIYLVRQKLNGIEVRYEILVHIDNTVVRTVHLIGLNLRRGSTVFYEESIKSKI